MLAGSSQERSAAGRGELAELEAELSAVEMGIRETLAKVSGRRKKVTRALLQSAVDMRALLLTRR